MSIADPPRAAVWVCKLLGAWLLLSGLPAAPGSPAVLYTLHTPPRDIGRIAQRTGAKMLLLSHLNPTIDAARDAVRASIQVSYTGPIEFARDGWRDAL